MDHRTQKQANEGDEQGVKSQVDKKRWHTPQLMVARVEDTAHHKSFVGIETGSNLQGPAS